MTSNFRSALDLDGLLGAREEAVRDRLGEPAVDRRVGHERWLVYERADLTIRLRLESVAAVRALVRSWTVTFAPARDSLEDACDAVGVTPAAGDSLDALPSAAGMIRRPLPDAATGGVHSLTARARAGRVRSLTAFDEPPDWRPGTETP